MASVEQATTAVKGKEGEEALWKGFNWSCFLIGNSQHAVRGSGLVVQVENR